MATRKEFEYKINVDTSAANKNLQSSVKQINLTNKSISDLNKELRRQIAVYKELTAEQRGSDIGKQVQENIQAIQ
ncbi:MAG: hypothetical protein NZ519_14035, partial [Bacteroidia bacterium]|nr:hypothetical protein [Bacteroidia bacterium]